jgi:cyclopropane-fatty-acyl-phospholipid synthase
MAMCSSISSSHEATNCNSSKSVENPNVPAPDFGSKQSSLETLRKHWNLRIRLEYKIVNRLRNDWQGPAIAVIIENRRHLVGEGEPDCEVVIHRPGLIRQIWLSPELAFGEAYMRGHIEVRGSLKSLMHAFHATRPENLSPWTRRFARWLRGMPKTVSSRRATANARHHYDIGTEFYALWLDPSLTYSCAYFQRGDETFATAQEQKLELLCRKVHLSQGHSLLDIGCGWGSLIFHAARKYAARCTGLTAAIDQTDYIDTIAKRTEVTHRVQALRADWREINGKYDRIISVGMFEYVGAKQYPRFFYRWSELLADGGLSILHTIGRMKRAAFDPWIDKYIFPGGYLPTLTEISCQAARAGMCILDVENLKQHYALTLEHWLTNFHAALDQIVASHGQRFTRMWSLYLHGAEAAFRWGDLQLWQIVLAKDRHHTWPLNREINASKLRGSVETAQNTPAI